MKGGRLHDHRRGRGLDENTKVPAGRELYTHVMCRRGWGHIGHACHNGVEHREWEGTKGTDWKQSSKVDQGRRGILGILGRS